MSFDTVKQTLLQYNQSHLLDHWDDLAAFDKKHILEQIEKIDWHFTTYLDSKEKVPGEIQPMGALTIADIDSKKDVYREAGIKAIKNNELCLLLLAGGQGTRLGFDKPKGTFNVGVNKDLYIFELLINNTLKIVREADTWIHLYIMTSDINNADTVAFFKEHSFFGYNEDYIHFFIQEMNPCTDFSGKILMNSKSSLAMSPNGNGGWFSSLESAGLLDEIYNSNLKWINVFSVDNVLQQIADPVFLGATISENKMSGAKVVYKAAPDEKVGAMCLENGKPHIIEYYELSKEMSEETKEDGKLAYGYGVILNYLFPIERLKHTLNQNMPLHVVKKTIPYIDEQGVLVNPTEPNGYKFETLALDLVHEMDDCLVFEVDRTKEFAPIKNKVGVDSVESARKLLEVNNIEI